MGGRLRWLARHVGDRCHPRTGRLRRPLPGGHRGRRLARVRTHGFPVGQHWGWDRGRRPREVRKPMDRRTPGTAAHTSAAAVLVAVVLGALAACGSSAPSSDEPSGASAASSATSTPTATTAPSTAAPGGGQVTKLLVSVVENHSLDQMQQEMPWLNSVAQRYGYATNYQAITHPSLPNYLAMAGGDTYGITDDASPAGHPIDAPSVFGQALDAGRTATVYAEAMSTPCEDVNDGTYAVRHNPWTYYVAERQQCQEHDLPLPALQQDVAASNLPNIGLVVPDTCNDAHDCPLSQADEWMRQYVGLVLAGPDFASGRLVVVVTADEDDRHHDNRILTVVAHPSLEHQVSSTALNHYSLSRAYAETAGI